MHIKPFIFFCLLIFGISTNAAPQIKDKSYIVTKANDTIYGKIKINHLLGGLKLITSDSTYKINPNTYTAYYNAKEKALYRSKVLPSLIPLELARKLSTAPKSDWLRCIEDGKITLYELKSSTYGYQLDNTLGITTTLSLIIATGGIPNTEFTNWYIEKDGTPLSPIKYNSFASTGSKTRKERKVLLSDLLADNLTVSKRHNENNELTFKMVRSLVHEYNHTKS